MSPSGPPSYLELHGRGGLRARAVDAARHLEACDLCPRRCRVDRTRTIAGAACHTGVRAMVHGFGPHFGEEAPLTGSGGSGTIFFSWCNLHCVYCQNWEISQDGAGRIASAEDLAGMMVSLQDHGCHNINLVSPSHVVAQIIEAVAVAADRGLHLPLVYNTGGYDCPEALALLDGIVDIYMPDMKYAEPASARHYSIARDYVEVNRAAVKEMHRQVGDLAFDEQGVARRGLLVRHLVLPDHLSGTEEVLSFLAREISPATYVNVMNQYRPCYRAHAFPGLDRPLAWREYVQALETAHHLGLARAGHH